MSMLVENFDELLQQELAEVKSDSLKFKLVALKKLFVKFT
jgi:hypothetical protein